MGTFSEIAHNRVRGRATSFKASFERRINNVRGRRARPGDSVTFEVTFGRKDGVPYPTTRRLYDGQRSLEVAEDNVHIRVSERKSSAKLGIGRPSDDNELVPLRYVAMHLRRRDWSEDSGDPEQDKPKDSFSDVEMDRISELARSLDRRIFHREIAYPPFAGAPVRSTPKRTYDPTRPFQDPSGEYIPTLLVNISRRDQQEWERLKAALENFGKSSGLFDEISIELLGKTEGSPFQLHVRKSGGKLKGRKRNLIDVGYGVSQVLPVLTELLRKDQPSMFLLQQPEVHLHPSAQAALGTLFCGIASWQRQLIVETHSDHLLDRVRMDVRDRATNLKPEDVSILYFEPNGLDVKIHSLTLDDNGNVLNAPLGYRQFFMDPECAQSLTPTYEMRSSETLHHLPVSSFSTG